MNDEECKIIIKELDSKKADEFNKKHPWFGKNVFVETTKHVFPKKNENKIEKCARCKKELGWKLMHCHEIINEWLCNKCDEEFDLFFEKFKDLFLSNKELSNDER